MSATTSAATGRCFGIQRVCQVWERSRSALYARRARAHHHRLGGGAGAGGGRRRDNRTRSCWRRFGPISLGPRSTAKAIARSTPGFGSWTGSESPARGCCASCRRTDCSPRTRGRQGPAKTHDGRVITQAPNVMWGTDGVAGIHARRRGGAGSSRQSNTGTRSAWGGTCAKSGAASRHSIRLRKGSTVAMARWTPTSPVGWRFGWITVVSTCQTTSSSKSGIGGSTPASVLSRNRKRTVWRSGGIVRSRSKRSTAESFRTSRPVRAAVADFVERYNQTWRLEKLGYHTPIEAREEYELRQAA